MRGVWQTDHRAVRHDGTGDTGRKIASDTAEFERRCHDRDQRCEYGVGLDHIDHLRVVGDAVRGGIAAAIQEVVAML